MITKIIHIAWLYLKMTFQSRSTFVMSFLMPLIFTFVLGQTMGGAIGQTGDGPSSFKLAVVNHDRGELGVRLIGHLEQNAAVDLQIMEESNAMTALDEETVLGVLVIPADSSARLLADETIALAFYQHPENIPQAQILEQAIVLAAGRLDGSLQSALIAADVAEQMGLFEVTTITRDDYFQTSLTLADGRWEAGPRVTSIAQAVTQIENAENVIPLGVGQSAPGMLVMFAMFFMLGGGAALIDERSQGTLRRLVVMPAHRGTILMGKFLGIFLSGVVNMVALIMLSGWLFQVNWGNAPGGLAAMVLVYSFTVTSLGILLAALVRTASQANALGTLGVMAMSALGGAWWPIEIVPGWMQQLALVFPTGWAMRGFHDIITRGLSLEAIVVELLAIAVFGLAFLVVGIWKFKYE